MSQNPRFKIVFAKLRTVLEEDLQRDIPKVHRPHLHEVTAEELDELDHLRRIVLEVTEPEPVSYTTT